jgi:hypothetical protein
VNTPDHCPSVRLAAAGFATLGLVLWIDLVPGALVRLSMRDVDTSSSAAFVSLGFCYLILLVLTPVFWHGPQGDRWLAGLAALYPAVILGIIGLRSVPWAF